MVRRRQDAVSADVSGSVVVLGVARGVYCGLDEISSWIWRALAEPLTVVELCDRLLESFDGDRATIEHDVLALLDQLMEQDLLVEWPAPGPG